VIKVCSIISKLECVSGRSFDLAIAAIALHKGQGKVASMCSKIICAVAKDSNRFELTEATKIGTMTTVFRVTQNYDDVEPSYWICVVRNIRAIIQSARCTKCM